MPKLKTIKSAAKRFKKTGKGGFKRGHSHKRHILTKKGGKRIRQLRGEAQVHDSDVKEVQKMLPYS
ncbi:MAG TPA: 50S ribosomal protein L35 [Nevskiaceae bacterium]|nr:50S ribosomal protein L35 [Nevskiaceae bacterium]